MHAIEKILAKNSGRAEVHTGEIVTAKVDFAEINDLYLQTVYSFYEMGGEKVWNRERAAFVFDHYAPCPDIKSAANHKEMREFAKKNDLRFHFDTNCGVCHQVMPEAGVIYPGMIVVATDSHTTTHGAFGAMGTGCGATDMATILMTGELWFRVPEIIEVRLDGEAQKGVYPKDVILEVLGRIRADGAVYKAIDFTGSYVEKLNVAGRMTICNMSIEGGARAGMIAPDETTFEYLKGRPHAPKGEMWDKAVEYWKSLVTDDDAVFDKEITLRADELSPFVTWGTNPGQGIPLNDPVPSPEDFADPTDKAAAESALQYMGLEAGTPMRDIAVDTVFIGSCTNGRIEDLRAAAAIMKGRHKAENLHRVLVVPASSRARLQAEKEGLDKIFLDFGAEWRNAGCSMCLGMNQDQMVAHERAVSTSNRNFEGRQGKGSRTHLASPLVAAATAVRGTISSPSDLEPLNDAQNIAAIA